MALNRGDGSLAVVGGLTLAAVLVFSALFIHSTNRALTQKRSHVWLTLPTAEGLQKGDRVLFRGVQVGEVKSLEFDAGRVLVRATLTRPVPLTSTATGRLVAADIFGRQTVILVEGPGGRPLARGDTLAAVPPMGLTDRIDGVVSRVERVMGDTMLGDVQSLLHRAAAAAGAIDETAGAARYAMATQSDNLSRLLGEGAAVAGGLRAAADSASLVALRDALLADAVRIGSVLEQLEAASAALAGTARRVDAGEGSIGLLTRDPDLYLRTVAVLESLEHLLTDVRANPRRYINVRIF
jgi:phospholipid/cholesterol/gamma-HCH transport system substrate-binding protein